MRKTRKLSRLGFIHFIKQGLLLEKSLTIVFDYLGKHCILINFLKNLVMIIDQYIVGSTK